MTVAFDPDDRVVVIATDEAFTLPAAVTLRSAAASCVGAIQFVVLHDRVPAGVRDQVTRSVPVDDSCIHWIDMRGRNVATTDRMHLPGAANYRLFIDQLDIEWPDRVLYIDVDTIVRHDLGSLWDIDLEDNAVAAVRSVNFPSVCSYGAIDRWASIGLDPREPFFNSGFLLIDMHRWLTCEMGEKIRAFLVSPDAASPNADQEALNVCLSGHWLELGPEWNQQAPLHEDNRGVHLMYDDDRIERARLDPVIVHFTDRPKPWHRNCAHPWRDEWRSIAAETAFVPIELEHTPLKAQAKWRLKRAASALIKGR